jgi:hypothetical protein
VVTLPTWEEAARRLADRMFRHIICKEHKDMINLTCPTCLDREAYDFFLSVQNLRTPMPVRVTPITPGKRYMGRAVQTPEEKNERQRLAYIRGLNREQLIRYAAKYGVTDIEDWMDRSDITQMIVMTWKQSRENGDG